VKNLISDLLDDKMEQQAILRTYQVRRMQLADDSIEFAADERNFADRVIGRWIFAPKLNHDANVLLDVGSWMIDAGIVGEWPECESRLDHLAERSDVKRVLLFDSVVQWWERFLLDDFRHRTDRHILAVALATRWYATEHQQALPARLDDLMPRYLLSVPSDPMASGSALLYRSGGDPVIYSVGENRVDDGGSDDVIADKSARYFRCYKDNVFHLKGKTRTAAPDYFVDGGIRRRFLHLPMSPSVDAK
jgi:hypothetical protein